MIFSQVKTQKRAGLIHQIQVLVFQLPAQWHWSPSSFWTYLKIVNKWEQTASCFYSMQDQTKVQTGFFLGFWNHIMLSDYQLPFKRNIKFLVPVTVRITLKACSEINQEHKVVSSTNSFQWSSIFKFTFLDPLPSSYHLKTQNIDHAYKLRSRKLLVILMCLKLQAIWIRT